MSPRGTMLTTGVLLGALVGACGGGAEDDTTSSGPGGTPSATSTQATGTSTGGAGQGGAGTSGIGGGTGGEGEGGSSEGTGGGGPSCADEPLGPTVVVAVDGGDCIPVGGSSVLVETPPDYLTQLVTVGQSLAAGGPFAETPVFLDGDGSAPIVDYGTLVAARGGVLGVLDDTVALRRFTEDGASLGAPSPLDGALPHALGANAAGWLLGWRNGEDVEALRLDADGEPLGSAEVVTSSWSELGLRIVAAAGGDAPAIAVSGRRTPSVARVELVTWADDGSPRLAESLCSPRTLALVEVAAVEDGWVLLLSLGDTAEKQPLLVRLDAEGTVVGAARTIGGFLSLEGMVVNGGTVMVTGQLVTGEPAVRAFDASGLEPLGPPVCLAASAGYRVAGAADGDGFVFLHDDETSAFYLTRTDGLGVGR